MHLKLFYRIEVILRKVELHNMTLSQVTNLHKFLSNLFSFVSKFCVNFLRNLKNVHVTEYQSATEE